MGSGWTTWECTPPNAGPSELVDVDRKPISRRSTSCRNTRRRQCSPALTPTLLDNGRMSRPQCAGARARSSAQQSVFVQVSPEIQVDRAKGAGPADAEIDVRRGKSCGWMVDIIVANGSKSRSYVVDERPRVSASREKRIERP